MNDIYKRIADIEYALACNDCSNARYEELSEELDSLLEIVKFDQETCDKMSEMCNHLTPTTAYVEWLVSKLQEIQEQDLGFETHLLPLRDVVLKEIVNATRQLEESTSRVIANAHTRIANNNVRIDRLETALKLTTESCSAEYARSGAAWAYKVSQQGYNVLAEKGTGNEHQDESE